MTAMFAALGRTPNIEYIDMPESIRDNYQYFTQADMRQSAPRRLQRRLHDARRGREALREPVSRSRRPLSLSKTRGGRSSMFDFEEALRLIPKQTVLCVGDVMLDDFVYGEVTRISPEAPTPVLAVKHNTIEIGGAGNVARNIAALGANCIFVGLVGDDEAGAHAAQGARQARRASFPNW